MSSNSTIIVAGIDVSKRTLDVCIHSVLSHQRFEYDASSLKDLIVLLKANHVDLVVCEATGGLENRLVAAISGTGVDIHVANPRRVRDFAKADGQLAKTDKIDAAIIAKFGVKMDIELRELPCENRQKLKSAANRYAQIVKNITIENNRLGSEADPENRGSLERSIKHYKKELKEVQQRMEKIIESVPEFKNNAKLLESCAGVGQLTAQRLVAFLPELGTCNRQKIARLVGLAPINRDSGTMRGKRTIGGGRKQLRTMLYLPTLVAIRFNPRIKKIYQGLLNKGKPKMVAIAACMRKLVILLNAMIREQKNWQEFIKYV